MSKNTYNRVTTSFVSDLKKILPMQAIVYDDPEELEAYSKDESGSERSLPEVVVKPSTADQVSEVVKLCCKHHIPITPRGAGSGLSGGAIPIHGGLVLSLEKMDRILEIDENDMIAVTEAGVVTNILCQEAAAKRLYYAGYPMSVETSFIGGNAATNAGGSKTLKYGNTAKHILGAEVVLPNGETLVLGGKRRKDSSGYNLLQTLIGSEGTLGIFTKLYLNLIPHPGKIVDLLVPFRQLNEALEAVFKVITATERLPSALEFIGGQLTNISCRYNNTSFPDQQEASACLVIQYEGEEDRLMDVCKLAGSACMEAGAIDIYVADNRINHERIWKVRRNTLEALRAIDPHVITGDVVVPLSQLINMIMYIKELSEESGTEIAIVAHASDGNIHPAPFSWGKDMSIQVKRKHYESILDRIALKAADLGGAVSGEHGIGLTKKKLLAKTKTAQIKVMKQMKMALDPLHIMNPGKIFDLD